MEGLVSSADLLPSSLDSPSAVNRKMKGSVLWPMKTNSETIAESIQKHAFVEIFSQSLVTVALNGICLSSVRLQQKWQPEQRLFCVYMDDET